VVVPAARKQDRAAEHVREHQDEDDRHEGDVGERLRLPPDPYQVRQVLDAIARLEAEKNEESDNDA